MRSRRWCSFGHWSSSSRKTGTRPRRQGRFPWPQPRSIRRYREPFSFVLLRMILPRCPPLFAKEAWEISALSSHVVNLKFLANMASALRNFKFGTAAPKCGEPADSAPENGRKGRVGMSQRSPNCGVDSGSERSAYTWGYNHMARSLGYALQHSILAHHSWLPAC